MNSKFKTLIKDIAVFAIGALGSKVLLFLLLPLYTNILTDAEYGIADLVFTIGQLMLPFISLAIFNGLIRFGLMKDVKRENVLLCSAVVFIVGSFVSIIVTPIFGFYRAVSQWKWYLCIYVVVQFAFTNTLTYLKVKDKNSSIRPTCWIQCSFFNSSKMGNKGLSVINYFINGNNSSIRFLDGKHEPGFEKIIL